eukprot:jgi/Orpsp1_1/1184893/evm.model.c7180000091404.1
MNILPLLLLVLLINFDLINAEDYDDYFDEYEERDYYVSSEYRDTIKEVDNFESKYMDIEIHCLQGRDEYCKYYKEQLEPVVEEIENIIDFKRKIYFSLYFFDLHFICNKCLSVALPPNYVFLRESGSNQVYSYPQALARQLDINESLDFADMDFTIAINIEHDIEDIKIMGKFALAREILHGMGITLTGELVNSRGYKLFEEDFYVPQLRAEIKLGDEVEDVKIKYKRFYPLNVFEKYIVAQAFPDVYIFDTLNDIYKIEYPTQRFNYMKAADDESLEGTALYNAYQTIFTSNYYEKGKEIARLFKRKGTVGFKANDGTIVPLQTFNDEFYRSISVCHIDIPKISDATFYDYDPFNKNEIKEYLNEDFIMNYTYMFMYDASEIADIVSNKKNANIIGPGVIKILRTMGWKIKGDNGLEKTKYLVADDIHIDYDNYLDLALKLSGEHDFYKKGYSALGSANNLVCDIKSYLITMFIIGIFI